MVVKSIYNATPDSDDYETDCVKTKELIISFREDVFSSVIHVASIPGRVFAFITVRRTTGPGTSCLRMRQSFVRF